MATLGQFSIHISRVRGQEGRAFIRVAMTMVVSLLNILLVMLSAFAVVVTMSTVRVVVEKCQAKNVGQKSKATDNANQLGILDFLRLYQSLDGF